MIILDSEYKDSLHSKDNLECRRCLRTFIVGIIRKNGENNKIIIFWNRCLLKNHTTCMYCNFVFRSSLFVFFYTHNVNVKFIVLPKQNNSCHFQITMGRLSFI